MLPWWTRQGTNEGVDWAWKVLNRLDRDSRENGNINDIETQVRMKLLTDWLNFTINSWRLLTKRQSETKTNETSFMSAEQVLTKLDSFGPHILPDVQTYAMIVNAKTLHAPLEAFEFAESVLERMHDESQTNHAATPNTVTYNSAINALTKSALPHVGEKAEEVMQQMEA
jgi:hypothetical protein